MKPVKIHSKTNHVYIAVLPGLGTILGKPILDNENNIIGLERPRVPVKLQGIKEIQVAPILGEPDELFFGTNPNAVYELRQRDLLDKYAESASGIKITNTMPSMDKQ